MNYPKSIMEQIECLARLTGASDSFIGQVKQLFTRKGIPLDADAEPYLPALEEAFRREETIRANAQRARQHLRQSHTDFGKVGQAYVRQLEQRNKPVPTKPGKAKAKGGAPTITIQGDHRTYITRPQREDMPMVPGPKDPQ